MLTYLFMGALLILIGFSVHVLKWNMLIAGYNTMPKEKRRKVDTDRLGKHLGYYGYISGGFFLVMALLEFLGVTVPPTPVTTLFIIYTMIVLYQAQKFDGNTKLGQKYNERK